MVSKTEKAKEIELLVATFLFISGLVITLILLTGVKYEPLPNLFGLFVIIVLAINLKIKTDKYFNSVTKALTES